MHLVTTPETLAAFAVIPEQLPAYVRAVSGSAVRICRGYGVYLNGGTAVVAGFPAEAFLAGNSWEERMALLPKEQLDSALEEISSWERVRSLIVLAPSRPFAVPHNILEKQEPDDFYYELPLPFFPPRGEARQQKLRNMLRRAAQEVVISRELWSEDCLGLVTQTMQTRTFGDATQHIFSRIGQYTKAAPQVVLFVARNRRSGTLEGLCVGDFTSLTTAMYMFAFRQPDAPPGTADLLLAALVREAEHRGHQRVNLGLAINSGIHFFKKKWGARILLPYREYRWENKRSKGLFSTFLARRTD